MDTEFWGPSGWKLLHSITYNYPNYPSQKIKNIYKRFFLILVKILPCKYCKDSLKEFYKELPIINYLENRNTLTMWIYLIHNKVNNKLRKQKLLNKPNPLKSDVDKIYKKAINKKHCCPECFGWEFIYSIAFNYPKTDKRILRNDTIKNIYTKFFKYLGDVITCEKVKTIYNVYIKKYKIENYLDKRDSLTEWLYRFECEVKSKHMTKIKYEKVCKRYEKVKVTSCKKTCRKDIIINNKIKKLTKKKLI